MKNVRTFYQTTHIHSALVGMFILFLLLGLQVGCNIIGFAAYVAGDNLKVDAQYKLEPKKTLILVDDPNQLLGSPAIEAVLARSIDHNLLQNDAFGDPKKVDVQNVIVSQRQLYALQSELGTSYHKTPADQIARLLEAEQVIYVLVESVQYQTSPNIYQPEATAQVKVLDVVNRKRLFPPLHEFQAAEGIDSVYRPGYRVHTQMRPSNVDEAQRSQPMVLQQELARRMGRDIARLFYNWERTQAGRRFED